MPDGTVYKGDFKKGKKDGVGVLIKSDISEYKGQFQHNQFYGYGEYKIKNGI